MLSRTMKIWFVLCWILSRIHVNGETCKQDSSVCRDTFNDCCQEWNAGGCAAGWDRRQKNARCAVFWWQFQCCKADDPVTTAPSGAASGASGAVSGGGGGSDGDGESSGDGSDSTGLIIVLALVGIICASIVVACVVAVSKKKSAGETGEVAVGEKNRAAGAAAPAAAGELDGNPMLITMTDEEARKDKDPGKPAVHDVQLKATHDKLVKLQEQTKKKAPSGIYFKVISLVNPKLQNFSSPLFLACTIGSIHFALVGIITLILMNASCAEDDPGLVINSYDGHIELAKGSNPDIKCFKSFWELSPSTSAAKQYAVFQRRVRFDNMEGATGKPWCDSDDFKSLNDGASGRSGGLLGAYYITYVCPTLATSVGAAMAYSAYCEFFVTIIVLYVCMQLGISRPLNKDATLFATAMEGQGNRNEIRALKEEIRNLKSD